MPAAIATAVPRGRDRDDRIVVGDREFLRSAAGDRSHTGTSSSRAAA
jgi:hypothetical protein